MALYGISPPLLKAFIDNLSYFIGHEQLSQELVGLIRYLNLLALKGKDMPYLNVRVSLKESPDIAEKIVAVLMSHTSTVLGKKPEVTSVDIEFVSPERWFVGGSRVSDINSVTFYLDIKVTEGTNTKTEKAKYVQEVFKDIESIVGPITPASYIVIHDVRADSWGFQGSTQEFRFIQAQSL